MAAEACSRVSYSGLLQPQVQVRAQPRRSVPTTAYEPSPRLWVTVSTYLSIGKDTAPYDPRGTPAAQKPPDTPRFAGAGGPALSRER